MQTRFYRLSFFPSLGIIFTLLNSNIFCAALSPDTSDAEQLCYAFEFNVKGTRCALQSLMDGFKNSRGIAVIGAAEGSG